MPPKKHARQASQSELERERERRRSTRLSIRGGQQKSSYFEDSNESADDSGDARTSKPKAKRARSSMGGRRQVDSESEQDEYKEESEEENEEEEEENEEKEDDDDDDDDDGEDEEDKKPKVTFTPHKQMRGLGGVEYTDSLVHPNTMLFLADLKANNRRSWLKENDPEFRRALSDWQSYVESLTARLIADVDDTIPELPARDVIFRIYRDIRFSHDSTPYKPHFSAAWSRTGRKGPYAFYYVHCEPEQRAESPATEKGKKAAQRKQGQKDKKDKKDKKDTKENSTIFLGRCFVSGGLWHPEAASLQLLRASIDERPRRWRRLLAGTSPAAAGSDPDAFRRTFLPGVPQGDEAAAVAAFAKLNADGALKSKPKGFAADHRDIALLKLRNFTATKEIPDSYFTDADGQDKIIEILQAMKGFVTHLNRIVRPDPGDDDDDDDEE